MAGPAAFLRKSVAYGVNGWRLLREQPAFKVGFIAIFALVCESGLWVLFAEGFRFLDQFGGMTGIIMGKLFSFFFLGMGLMLVASGMVTTYATLYRSDEIAYLLVRPLPVSQVVVYKFFESAYFSSWAFLFIIVPFVGAYAVHERLSPIFAVWTALFALPFLVICAGVGALAIMIVVRYWPRRLNAKPLAAALVAVGIVFVWRAAREIVPEEGARFALSGLIPGIRLAGNMLIPSTWTADGILAMGRGVWGRGFLLLGVVMTTAAALTIAVEALGSRVFQPAWERLNEGTGRKRRRGVGMGWLEGALVFLPRDVRAMVMKDIRTFFRDPMQWSQAVIFFGLLGMYFLNLRKFNYDAYSPQWRNMVCFLNVFSVSAVLCSLGARFIYPQLSLEGQGFWLVGLSPTSIRRVLFAKFGLALSCTVLVSVLLIGLSSAMLRVEPLLLAVSIGLIGCIAVAVNGLSTGLGAIFMDLRQRNPAAIVGSFGGTVNLVLGLGFLLATILPLGLVFHLRAGELIGPLGFARAAVMAGAWCVFLTTLAVWIPLAWGLRSLQARDF